jgi:ATP-dependent helicase HepA
MSGVFVPGAEVTVQGRGDAIVLAGPVGAGANAFYKVHVLNESAPMKVAAHNLRPRVEEGPIAQLLRGRGIDADSWLAGLTAYRCLQPITGHVYAYRAARIRFEPLQLKPLLKWLRSLRSRLLIADEVGFGKTIEAGLILQELRARQAVRRVLVVCPPILVTKWRREMNRFSLHFEHLDRPRLDQFLGQLEAEMNPELLAVGSYTMLRRPDTVQQLVESGLRWDLVIVDEAHHARNSGTQTHALVQALSDAADSLVFLTATPLQTKSRDLFTLFHLLEPEEVPDFETFEWLEEPASSINRAAAALNDPSLSAVERAARALPHLEELRLSRTHREIAEDPRLDDAIDALQTGRVSDRATRVRLTAELQDMHPFGQLFTRSRKRDHKDIFPVRRPVTVAVSWTKEEVDLYEQVTLWASRRAEASGLTYGHPFILTMPQRQAASCLPGVIRYIEDCEHHVPTQPDLPAEEGGGGDDADPIEPEEDLAQTWHMVDTSRDAALLEAIKACRGIDTKYDRFLEATQELVDEGADRILVFMFFRRSLDHLTRSVAQDRAGTWRILRMDGSTPMADRQAIIDRFWDDDPTPTLLLSSEVGSEGLDFQRATVLVNYDLPWNPMRVEQRIGRLDRVGADPHKPITIVNFKIAQTIEDRIFLRLYERLDLFRRSVGDIEDLLGQEVGRLQKEIASQTLTMEEAQRRTDKVADNLIRSRAELEALESDRDELIGQDALFQQQVAEIGADGLFVGAAELERFLKFACSRRWPGTTVRVRDGLGRLTVRGVSDRAALAGELASFAQQHLPGGSRELKTFLTGDDEKVPFVITESAAEKHGALSFVTPAHPLPRYLAHWLKEQDSLSAAGLLRVGLKALQSESAQPGWYALFLHVIETTGLKLDRELRAFAFGADGAPARWLEDSFFRWAPLAESGEVEDASTILGAIDGLVARADAAAQSLALEREDRIAGRNNRIIDRRLETMATSFERRRRMIRKRIADLVGREHEVGVMKVLRMRRAQEQNLAVEAERRRLELERGRSVSAATRLVSVAVVYVHEEGA